MLRHVCCLRAQGLLWSCSGVAVARFHCCLEHARSRAAGSPHVHPPAPTPRLPPGRGHVACAHSALIVPLRISFGTWHLNGPEKPPPANPSPRRRLALAAPALFPFPFPAAGCAALAEVWHCWFAHPSGRGDVFITFPGDYLFKHSLTVTITRAARCVSQQKDTRC